VADSPSNKASDGEESASGDGATVSAQHVGHVNGLLMVMADECVCVCVYCVCFVEGLASVSRTVSI